MRARAVEGSHAEESRLLPARRVSGMDFAFNAPEGTPQQSSIWSYGLTRAGGNEILAKKGA